MKTFCDGSTTIYKQYKNLIKPKEIKTIDTIITKLEKETRIQKKAEKIEKLFETSIINEMDKREIKLQTPIEKFGTTYTVLEIGNQPSYYEMQIGMLKTNINANNWSDRHSISFKTIVNNKNDYNEEVINILKNSMSEVGKEIYKNYKEYMEKKKSIEYTTPKRKIYRIGYLTKEQRNAFGNDLPARTRKNKNPLINMTLSSDTYGTNMFFRSLVYWNANTLERNTNYTRFIKLELYKIENAKRIIECLKDYKKNIKSYIENTNNLIEETKEKNNRYFVLTTLSEGDN